MSYTPINRTLLTDVSIANSHNVLYCYISMQNKIKNWIHESPAKVAMDSRNIGLGVFAVIVLSVTWSGVKIVQTNYRLQKQIAEAQAENSLQELENNNARLRTNYLKSNQYLELSARRLFNRAAPGEKLIIVPKSVALTYAPALQQTELTATPQKISTPWYGANIQAWFDFFAGRKPID